MFRNISPDSVRSGRIPKVISKLSDLRSQLLIWGEIWLELLWNSWPTGKVIICQQTKSEKADERGILLEYLGEFLLMRTPLTYANIFYNVNFTFQILFLQPNQGAVFYDWFLLLFEFVHLPPNHVVSKWQGNL